MDSLCSFTASAIKTEFLWGYSCPCSNYHYQWAKERKCFTETICLSQIVCLNRTNSPKKGDQRLGSSPFRCFSLFVPKGLQKLQASPSLALSRWKVSVLAVGVGVGDDKQTNKRVSSVEVRLYSMLVMSLLCIQKSLYPWAHPCFA